MLYSEHMKKENTELLPTLDNKSKCYNINIYIAEQSQFHFITGNTGYVCITNSDINAH